MLKNMDIMKLMDKFHSEDECLDVLEDLRWPDGVTCSRCNSKSISRVYNKQIWNNMNPDHFFILNYIFFYTLQPSQV